MECPHMYRCASIHRDLMFGQGGKIDLNRPPTQFYKYSRILLPVRVIADDLAPPSGTAANSPVLLSSTIT
jgi:hypothetical protein